MDLFFSILHQPAIDLLVAGMAAIAGWFYATTVGQKTKQVQSSIGREPLSAKDREVLAKQIVDAVKSVVEEKQQG
ncbi:MAG: hypothetical protein AAF810_04905 [Cyanobacteria bacterium P01_D01_bin.36]